MRIDVLNESLTGAIDQILQINSHSGGAVNTRVSTSFFSNEYKTGTAPTNEATTAKDSIYSHGIFSHHSNTNQALQQFSDFVGTQGSGNSAADPIKVAILITDGVRDETFMSFSPAALGVIDHEKCSLLKNKGIDLAVLEIKYLKFIDPYGFYYSRLAWYYDDISPTLKSCASTDMHYTAEDSEMISAGLQEVLAGFRNSKLRLLF